LNPSIEERTYRASHLLGRQFSTASSQAKTVPSRRDRRRPNPWGCDRRHPQQQTRL